jgi:hypothetical protein
MSNNSLESLFINAVMDFHNVMRENDISLVYEGEITHSITKAFTSLTEKRMEDDEEEGKTQKKVFHVMVECLQNISKHADNTIDSISKDGRGIFMVHKGDDKYKITTGNLITNDRVDELRESLDLINSLNKDELKDLFKKQIKEGSLSKKKGAGLGFIDIARKTGNKLVYKFKTIDEENAFFILTSTIDR